MTRSLSGDLRGRVIAAIEDGGSTREAARRFRIGISTAGAWYRRYRETGEMEARKQGQPSRSKLDAHGAFILGLIEKTPDITLAEIGERLVDERGVRAAPSTVWLFLDRRGVTFKKTAHASEQQRPDVLRRRIAWFDGQLDLDPDSSMRPRHPRRWCGCEGERHAVNGAGHPFHMDIGRRPPLPQACGYLVWRHRCCLMGR